MRESAWAVNIIGVANVLATHPRRTSRNRRKRMRPSYPHVPQEVLHNPAMKRHAMNARPHSQWGLKNVLIVTIRYASVASKRLPSLSSISLAHPVQGRNCRQRASVPLANSGYVSTSDIPRCCFSIVLHSEHFYDAMTTFACYDFNFGFERSRFDLIQGCLDIQIYDLLAGYRRRRLGH